MKQAFDSSYKAVDCIELLSKKEVVQKEKWDKLSGEFLKIFEDAKPMLDAGNKLEKQLDLLELNENLLFYE